MSTDIFQQMAQPNISSAVGAFSSGIGQLNNWQAKKNAFNFNATMAETNAKAEGQVGATNTAEDMIRNELAAGKQRAAFGQADTGGAGTGTAAIAVNQSTMFGDLQAMQDNYKTTVARFSQLNQANADEFGAKVAGRNATDSMLSTLMNTNRAFTYGSGAGF